MKRFNTDQIIHFKPIILAASIFIFLRSVIYFLLKLHYRGYTDCLWLVRVSQIKPFSLFSQRMISRHVKSIHKGAKNTILMSFLKGPYSKKYIRKYSISGKGEQDIFRDIIVLKSRTEEEHGVILLKYAQTFEAFLYFFDIERLLKNYYFVLEPCWAGYHNTNIFMWLFPGVEKRIIVQCYTQNDHKIISSLQPFLLPVSLGPADWVDTDIFKPEENSEKIFDVVMVANWAAIKQHIKLFQALAKIKDRTLNVLLVGYAWGGRNSQDILNESAIVANKNISINIKENLSHAEVVKYLRKSKVFLFLTRKEGDNKALVEAMFANVPVIVYDKTVGGAKSRVNEATGILSSYEDLHENILYMIDNYKKFSARCWCLEHTGSRNSTMRLNDLLMNAAMTQGNKYSNEIVEKINTPNLAYKHPEDKEKFSIDYKYIQQCKRT